MHQRRHRPHPERVRAHHPRGRPRDVAADEAILAATLALLSEEGYARMSMGGVAERAGVGKPTVYRRYRDKADLTAAALASIGGDVMAPVDTGSTRDDLVTLVRRFLRVIDEVGISMIAGLFAEEPRHPELVEAFRERMIRPRRELGIGVLRRGIERGELRSDIDVELVMDLLIGPTFSRTFAGVTRPRNWATKLVDTVWAGIAADG